MKSLFRKYVMPNNIFADMSNQAATRLFIKEMMFEHAKSLIFYAMNVCLQIADIPAIFPNLSS